MAPFLIPQRSLKDCDLRDQSNGRPQGHKPFRNFRPLLAILALLKQICATGPALHCSARSVRPLVAFLPMAPNCRSDSVHHAFKVAGGNSLFAEQEQKHDRKTLHLLMYSCLHANSVQLLLGETIMTREQAATVSFEPARMLSVIRPQTGSGSQCPRLTNSPW